MSKRSTQLCAHVMERSRRVDTPVRAARRKSATFLQRAHRAASPLFSPPILPVVITTCFRSRTGWRFPGHGQKKSAHQIAKAACQISPHHLQTPRPPTFKLTERQRRMARKARNPEIQLLKVPLRAQGTNARVARTISASIAICFATRCCIIVRAVLVSDPHLRLWVLPSKMQMVPRWFMAASPLYTIHTAIYFIEGQRWPFVRIKPVR